MTPSDWLNISAPYNADGEYDRCNIFDVDFDNIQQRPNETTPTIPCTNWEFDEGTFQVHFCSTL
jgi:hypothetical protein